MPILKIENLSKSFGERQLFKNLSMELEEGKIYSLMGANGAGKTTLFNILSGFVKADSGKVLFKNQTILSKSPAEINKMGIARTFQDLRLINGLTVNENVILSMKNNPSDKWLKSMLPENFHNKTNRVFKSRASEIIKQFFLSDVCDTLASDISFGQQKLLSLACCLANGASLLLLDEPVAGIQPEFRNKIAAIINQMKQQYITILLIEHNTDFINSITGKIFFLNDGNISIFNNVNDLSVSTKVMESYF